MPVLAKYNKNFLDTPEKNNSPQGDYSGSSSSNKDQDPKDNKPKKSSKQEDKNTKNCPPVYPHTPVKVYMNADVSRSDIIKDFKEVSRAPPYVI